MTGPAIYRAAEVLADRERSIRRLRKVIAVQRWLLWQRAPTWMAAGAAVGMAMLAGAEYLGGW